MVYSTTDVSFPSGEIRHTFSSACLT